MIELISPAMNWLWSGSLTALRFPQLHTSDFESALKMALSGFSCVKDGIHIIMTLVILVSIFLRPNIKTDRSF